LETEKINIIVIQEAFQGEYWKVLWRRNMIDDAKMLITKLKGNRNEEAVIINGLVPNHVHRYLQSFSTIWEGKRKQPNNPLHEAYLVISSDCITVHVVTLHIKTIIALKIIRTSVSRAKVKVIHEK
jgi:hypothetical protein